MGVTWTQDDINRLKAAIAAGARRVKFKDREIEYFTMRELQSALAAAEQAVRAESGAPSYTHISTSKGFDGGRCE